MTDLKSGLEITVPRLNSVDDTYLLTAWLVESGAAVTSGQPLATLESSKAAVDLEAPADGFVRCAAAVGSDCAVGDVIAVIEPEAGAPEPNAPAGTGAIPGPRAGTGAPPAASGADEPVLTAPARRLAEAHAITPDRLAALGLSVIREADVAALLDTLERPGRSVRMSPNQIAVRAAVEKSHREIPAAYAAVAVRLDAAQAAAVQHSRAAKTLIGVTELTVRAIARQLADHPHLFARLAPDDTLHIPETADVGVTMDAERGLFVPVVRDAAALAPADLARELMRLRRQAADGTLSAADLERPAIVLALNNADGVVSAVPLVFPGTTATVSLSAARHRLDLGADETVVRVSEAEVSVAYDHRVVNGRQAGAFLAAIRRALEDPHTLLEPGT